MEASMPWKRCSTTSCAFKEEARWAGWIHMASPCRRLWENRHFLYDCPPYRLANSERRRGSTRADLFVCNLGSNSLWHLSLMFYCKLERQFRFIASCLWLTHQFSL